MANGGRPRTEVGYWGKVNTTRTATGKYVSRARLRDSRGQLRPITRTGATRDEALRRLHDAMLDESRRVEGADITPDTAFRVVAEAYLDETKRNQAATTYDRYTWLLNRFVLPDLGDLPLRKVTARRLQLLFNEMRDHGYAAGTMKGVRCVISGAMGIATESGATEGTRLAGVKLKRGQLAYSDVSLTEDDAALLLSVAKQDKRVGELELYDLIVILLGTGCRISEALGLRWRDVHLSRHPADCYVNFRKNAVRVKGKGVVLQDGKSAASDRDNDMNEAMREVLMRRAAYEGNHLDMPVFPAASGKCRDPTGVRKLLRPIYAQVPAFERVTQPTHIFRKTVATAMDENNATAKQIADQLGHASIAMTQAVYMVRRGRRAERPEGSALDFVRASSEQDALQQGR